MVFNALQQMCAAPPNIVVRRWTLPIACAFALCFPPIREALDVGIQAAWTAMLYYLGDYATNYMIEASIAFVAWLFSCLYFSYLDVVRADTKIQKDYWPSMDEMLVVGVPQFFIYAGGCGYTWYQWAEEPEQFAIDVPERAPTFLEFSAQLTLALAIGDFLIYWEHRIMHEVPFLRNNIHSVHHAYSAPFSWAGGWVHPLEDAVVVIAQVIPAYLFCHSLTRWAFAALWAVLLIDEHSGHDVWWSPYNWLIPGHRSWGGGADPHDIHHYVPTKNYSFCFCVWDHLFGTYMAPSPDNVNGFVPPLATHRRSDDEIAHLREIQRADASRRAAAPPAVQKSTATTKSCLAAMIRPVVSPAGVVLH
eukprot:TRINITY_DN29900_c0_g1_i1.p1 TRINITY_DN29900_c0_g1~~TRINITY_DN29900_c0_g1_i1.p1  ORF type:complete len:362 (+),score=100.48 TRINITY_DN29900_c0_g1_i1:69-1154(+)